tara:strand:+ start:1998 stop:2516 length:519 start_codon:yes stop_codon:yes gene_type:complete
MNINQILIITFIIYFILKCQKNLEGFNGEVNIETCIQRMLNYECMDNEKREIFNNDCGGLQIGTPTGISNITCEDETLYTTLICNRMISEGACDCDYGRKQITNSCNIEPLFIRCPSELKEKDLEIVNKFKSLNKVVRKCRKDTQKEKKPYILYSIIGFLLIVVATLFFKRK